MSASRRAAVVGGGIIGTACAHYLCKSGWEVTIFEKNQFGMGCSHANCGLIVPSHVLPLAVPGAVLRNIRKVFSSNSPLRIRMRFDPSLWMWLLRFAGRCKTHHMMEAGRARQEMLAASMQLYTELIEQGELECEWQKQGTLLVFRTKRGFEEYAQTEELLRTSFDLHPTRYDGDELIRLEPSLQPGLAGAWHFESDAHLRPESVLSSWRKTLEASGVTVREGCEVKSIDRSNGRARALVTSEGEIGADAVVIAAGALTPFLQEQLGCRIPIQPGKGYSITMPRPPTCPKIPLIFEEHSVAVTPWKSGYRLGSTMEFAGYDAKIHPRRLEFLREAARHYLHEPTCDPVEEEWCGWRPMTYDGKPIIDRSPTMENTLIAAGHNMLGMSMAPSTGKLVAEILNGEHPHIDPSPYSAARF